jgi:hypothetical protein
MIEIKVEATAALAKFSPAGIPNEVRTALRRALPDLTRKLGDKVDDKLDSELKSRNRLQVKKELVEDPTKITGRVRVVSTSPPSFLPQIIETGAEPHVIAARNARALYFYWEKVGSFVSFQSVNHPGFPGIQPLGRSFAEMESEILSELENAVKDAVMGP